MSNHNHHHNTNTNNNNRTHHSDLGPGLSRPSLAPTQPSPDRPSPISNLGTP
ncbi:hypothetical protein BO71DRAFT_395060 [Aspergillus ellipticus CBS 707.79]|uniref:Uncharacterized protein n=1 Tax=Aspergillus ellipticus CBS 707.79 TaxID=1448320 RepID=A0A319DMA5_9EURO|nr:hypothetical protein BO71DRAFT_395060 [Aspergillus ellipticus CBS 707.79]